MQLIIKYEYTVHLLVIRCKYLRSLILLPQLRPTYVIIRDSQMMMHWGIETCSCFQIQLSIKYVVHLLVICCKYQRNSRYTKFRDMGFVGFTSYLPKMEIFCCTWILLSPGPKRNVVFGHGRNCATVFCDIARLQGPTYFLTCLTLVNRCRYRQWFCSFAW